MSIYAFPIRVAILSFLAFSGFFTFLYRLIQYWKYGSVSIYRTLVLFSFSFYMLCLYYLVILPLPAPQTLEPLADLSSAINLDPFRAARVFIAYTNVNLRQSLTILNVFREPSFLEPAFNILMTIPFGIYLGYYFKQSFKKVLLFSFLLSLFFELTQLSGLYGFYVRPYRYFDINDLMHNTLGGVFGFMIYRKFLTFLPARDLIDEKSVEKSSQITYMRRLFAFSLDYALILTVYRVVHALLFSSHSESGLVGLTLFHLILFGYFVCVHLLFNRTLGQKVVHLKIQPMKERLPYMSVMIVRYGGLIIVLFTIALLGYLVEVADDNGIYAIAYFLLLLLLLADVIFSFRHQRQLFYERVSKTVFVSTKRKA